VSAGGGEAGGHILALLEAIHEAQQLVPQLRREHLGPQEGALVTPHVLFHLVRVIGPAAAAASTDAKEPPAGTTAAERAVGGGPVVTNRCKGVEPLVARRARVGFQAGEADGSGGGRGGAVGAARLARPRAAVSAPCSTFRASAEAKGCRGAAEAKGRSRWAIT